MVKFIAGFISGIVWFWKAPGGAKLAQFLYDREVEKQYGRERNDGT